MSNYDWYVGHRHELQPLCPRDASNDVVEGDAALGAAQTAVPVIGAAFETMRPYQWLKNLLVFMPLGAAHRLGNRDSRLSSVFLWAGVSERFSRATSL